MDDVKFLNGLEAEYSETIMEKVDFLKEMKALMGDRYPEAMFIHPVLVDEATRRKIDDTRKVSGCYTSSIWRIHVQFGYDGLL